MSILQRKQRAVMTTSRRGVVWTGFILQGVVWILLLLLFGVIQVGGISSDPATDHPWVDSQRMENPPFFSYQTFLYTLIHVVDENGDGQLDRHEFVQLLKRLGATTQRRQDFANLPLVFRTIFYASATVQCRTKEEASSSPPTSCSAHVDLSHAATTLLRWEEEQQAQEQLEGRDSHNNNNHNSSSLTPTRTDVDENLPLFYVSLLPYLPYSPRQQQQQQPQQQQQDSSGMATTQRNRR